MNLTVYYSCNCRLCKREDPDPLCGILAQYATFVHPRNSANYRDEVIRTESSYYSDRMPTSETGGERTTKDERERSSPSNGSILGNDDGDGVPPELRAAMPNVVWSRQEDPSDDKVGQFFISGARRATADQWMIIRGMSFNSGKHLEARNAWHHR